jgi:hypothetical protein
VPPAPQWLAAMQRVPVRIERCLSQLEVIGHMDSPQPSPGAGHEEPESAPQHTQPDQPPQAAQQPTETQAVPVSTNFRRNMWLLVIVLGTVLVAWVLAVLWKRVPAGLGALEERPTPQVAPIAQPPAPRRPGPVALARIVGSGSEIIPASPSLAVETGGLPYRLARYFDVSKRAEGFKPDQLIRFPGRWADQRLTLVPDPKAVESPFRPAQEATGLQAQDRLAVVTVGDQTRAYPVRILASAAGIYDDPGGQRVFVCWSALTQAARCLMARVDESNVEWHDAGLAYRGNEVLYDAQTGSLWDSFSGQALAGPSVGRYAAHAELTVWPWERWVAEKPTSLVLSGGLSAAGPGTEAEQMLEAYLQSPTVPFETAHFSVAASPMPPKAFVLGIALGDTARAYPLAALSAASGGVLRDSFGGRPVEIHVTSPRTAYATCEGAVLDATVTLWFAWQEAYPETDLYQIRGEPAAGSPGAAEPQPQTP